MLFTNKEVFGGGGLLPMVTWPCIMTFNMVCRYQSHPHTHTHTQSRLPLWRLPHLPLVSFLLSLFIWIKDCDRIFSSLELSPVDEPVTWMRLVILLNQIQGNALMTKLWGLPPIMQDASNTTVSTGQPSKRRFCSLDGDDFMRRALRFYWSRGMEFEKQRGGTWVKLCRNLSQTPVFVDYVYLFSTGTLDC